MQALLCVNNGLWIVMKAPHSCRMLIVTEPERGTGDFSHYLYKIPGRIHPEEQFILAHSVVAGKPDGGHDSRRDPVET